MEDSIHAHNVNTSRSREPPYLWGTHIPSDICTGIHISLGPEALDLLHRLGKVTSALILSTLDL